MDVSIADIRHGVPVSDAGARKAQELREAFAALPPHAQDEVFAQLATVTATYKTTGQVDPVLHFVQSLEMTARLHRNPAYRKSLDEEAPTGHGEVVEIEDFMQRMHERHG